MGHIFKILLKFTILITNETFENKCSQNETMALLYQYIL
jgi:hypothetical protein